MVVVLRLGLGCLHKCDIMTNDDGFCVKVVQTISLNILIISNKDALKDFWV